MHNDRWNTETLETKVRGTDRGPVRFLIILGLLALVVGCIFGPRLSLVTGTKTFLTATTVIWFALGLLSMCIMTWFGRSSGGSSGQIGVAIFWLILRTVAWAVVAALGVGGVWAYGTMLVVGAIVFSILDVIFNIMCG